MKAAISKWFFSSIIMCPFSIVATVCSSARVSLVACLDVLLEPVAKECRDFELFFSHISCARCHGFRHLCRD